MCTHIQRKLKCNRGNVDMFHVHNVDCFDIKTLYNPPQCEPKCLPYFASKSQSQETTMTKRNTSAINCDKVVVEKDFPIVLIKLSQQNMFIV